MKVAKDIFEKDVEPGVYRFYFKNKETYVGCVYDCTGNVFVMFSDGECNKLLDYRNEILFIELIATE